MMIIEMVMVIMMFVMFVMIAMIVTQQWKDVTVEQPLESPPDKLQLAQAAQQPHNEETGQHCDDTPLQEHHHYDKKVTLQCLEAS